MAIFAAFDACKTKVDPFFESSLVKQAPPLNKSIFTGLISENVKGNNLEHLGLALD